MPNTVTTVELNVAVVNEEIPLKPCAGSEEKDRFVSKQKDVVLFAAYEANGLGPFYECAGPGKCSANCTEVLLTDVVASLPDGVKSAKVPTLGHQIYLAALSRRFDGTDLEEKARIRHQRCDRVSAARIQSGALPLKMIGATVADHPLFSELTFAKSRLIHAGVGVNLMGEIWEEVRHGAGKPLVSSPLIAFAPPGYKALVRGQHMTVEDAAHLLAANFYLQQHAYSGAVQLIILVLPPTTPQCSARLDALLTTVLHQRPAPPAAPQPAVRSQVFKVAPPMQRRQDDSRKRAYQPQQPSKASYYAKQPRKQ
ncbi:hypothetical protein AAVH_13707 [Aphelenchoides avenae]|nr:hypothetical protein AAVH_13707 [Aphelenchus avenae]